MITKDEVVRVLDDQGVRKAIGRVVMWTILVSFLVGFVLGWWIG